MLRVVGLDSIYGGFQHGYICFFCPWPNERRKPDWRRKIPGKHGPKSRGGRLRCYYARNGLDPYTGVRD